MTIPTCSPVAFWCSCSVLWSFWWWCRAEFPLHRGWAVSLHSHAPPLWKEETIRNFEIKSPSAARRPRGHVGYTRSVKDRKILCQVVKSSLPLSLRSRYSAAWSRVAILIADIWRWEEPRSRVCARPLLTGKACSVAGRAATKLPPAVASCRQLPLLARPGHQLPPATEERAQQFGACCPNLTIICPKSQMWDFT